MEIVSSYRTPQCAAAENTEITITARVLRRYSFIVRLVLRRDGGENEFIPMWWQSFEQGYDIFSVTVKLSPGLYWYTFDLWDFGIFEEKLWQLTVYEKDFTTPDFIKGGIIYHIFVDRFNRSGDTPIRRDIVFHENKNDTPIYAPNAHGIVENIDFYGGNLPGICEKLPYLNSLGVTAIYLSPIFKANSNHKYDTGNYEEIDEMFGTKEDFKELISECRKYGIQIICDGVFNHTGDDSLYFNKYGKYPSPGAFQSPDSPYADWYKFNESRTDYESWWGIKILPCTNKSDGGFTDYITGKDGIIEKWTKMGVSWRLDVADELPDNFLDRLRTAAKAQNPDCLIIGEVWEDASNKISYGSRRRYLLGRQLDSVMNYPLKDAIINYVTTHDEKMLVHTINTQLENYPPQVVHCLMNILGTHDTMRILTVLGGDDIPQNKAEMANYRLSPTQYETAAKRLKIASLLQMTLPGVPCIYYGDEAGMEGGKDPFNRRYFPWGNENKDLLEWYKKITALRRKYDIFISGDFKIIYAENGCLIYSRSDTLFVAINLSENIYELPEAIDLLSNEKKSSLLPGEYAVFDMEVI